MWRLSWKSWCCLELSALAEAMKKAVPEWIHDQHMYMQPRCMWIDCFAMLCFTEIKTLLPEIWWLCCNILVSFSHETNSSRGNHIWVTFRSSVVSLSHHVKKSQKTRVKTTDIKCLIQLARVSVWPLKSMYTFTLTFRHYLLTTIDAHAHTHTQRKYMLTVDVQMPRAFQPLFCEKQCQKVRTTKMLKQNSHCKHSIHLIS